LERDQNGRIWVNTRDKKFKIAQTTPVPAEQQPARPVAAPRPEPRAVQPPRAIEAVFAGSDSFLGRIRTMMRRNRHGHGWSGSFPYLTKALKLNEAQLLEKLSEFGLRLSGGDEPVLAREGNFEYYLNRNQRGEIWINAEEKLPGADAPASAPVAAPRTTGSSRGSEDSRDAFVPTKGRSAAKVLPPENTLTAMRLMMEPKKRGEGVTALVKDLAKKLEKTETQLQAILVTAGLERPSSPKAKPTFAEHGGEIYWLNVNAKGQVWLNAKQTAAKKSRAKKSD